MSGFFATGGAVVGGGSGGEWSATPAHVCRLEVVETGLVDLGSVLITLLQAWYRCGLYQNDRTPILGDTIAQYVPCDFSGYSGTKLVYGWSPFTMAGEFAVSHSAALLWKHNGGPVSNDVYGYYVVGNDGLLKFAERFCDGPFTIDRVGRSIPLALSFRVSNER